MTAYPGRNSASFNPEPFGHCNEFERWLPWEWLNGQEVTAWDYGVVRLDCEIGDSTGLFGFREFNQIDDILELAGYPVDKTDPATELWSSYGSLVDLGPREVYHNIDTFNSQSGSPIWEHNYPSCEFCSIANHRGGFEDVHNYASRVSSYFTLQLLYERENVRIKKLYFPIVR